MRRIDANRWFVPFIEKAIEDGFAPEVDSWGGGANGSQVWRKGRECIVIWADNHDTVCLDERHSVRTLVLSVARMTLESADPLSADWKHRWSSSWEEHVIASKTYYSVTYRYDASWWVEDVEDARAACETRKRRRDARSVNNQWQELALTDGLLAIARKVRGFKTVDSRHIHVYRRRLENSWKFWNSRSDNEVIVSAGTMR